VSVDADGIGRYPTELEAAVYFCCLEAMQNAAKHAPESSVSIVLRESDGAVQFTVNDDGPGFDEARVTAGHGYVNMSDRLGAIGGSVEWRSAPGEGAHISGTIPLP
jgi:signal transduction histidine kinase